MFWRVPKIWQDGECWIIGGGPSVAEQFDVPEEVVEKVRIGELPTSAFSPFMSSIHGKHVIGINGAYKLGDWIDLCFSGDRAWFINNHRELFEFPKLVACCDSVVVEKEYLYVGAKYTPKDPRRSRGIHHKPGMTCWNENSGACAMSIAYQMGVKRIILVGFDMNRTPEKKQHWHGMYASAMEPKIKANLPFSRHIAYFKDVAKDAERYGLEVINASPNSALPYFPKMSVKEVLDGK